MSLFRASPRPTLALLAFATTLAAQAQTGFTPRAGQQGKDVIWLPTPQVLVDRMLDMARVAPEDIVIDLGSGDGRLVISAAMRGARAVGVEYHPDLVEFSRRRAAAQGVSRRATFVRADLFETDLSQATVITLFLRDDLNLRLRPRLLDLKPGTRIVSNTFAMGDWEPDDLIVVERGCAAWCSALMWRVPAKVQGTWKLPQGGLTLAQTYQVVTGTLQTAAGSQPIADGRLQGDLITFTASGARYTGRVRGRTIEGTVIAAGRSDRWTATRIG